MTIIKNSFKKLVLAALPVLGYGAAPAIAEPYEFRQKLPSFVVGGASNALPTEEVLTGVDAALNLSTLELDFLSIENFTSKTLQLAVSYDGTNPKVGLGTPAISGDAGFSPATSCGKYLVPGQTCLIEVTFSPTEANDYYAELVLLANPGSVLHTVSMYGTAYNPVELFGGLLPTAKVGQYYSYSFFDSLDSSYLSEIDQSKVGWTLSKALPAGLTFDASTGVISGTPTAKTEPTLYQVNVVYSPHTSQSDYFIGVQGVAPMALKQIAMGGAHACALTLDNGVKCWGSGEVGKLGNGLTQDSYLPVTVAGLSSGVTKIATAVSHSCAITSSGGVKCWGNNSYGGLGDGTEVSSAVPVDVVGLQSGVVDVHLTTYTTCAVLSTGEVKCWGANHYGQLGNNTTSHSNVPVSVVGLGGSVQTVSLGQNFACAQLSSGAVKCWGANYYGQLGDGTTTDRHTPVTSGGMSSGASQVSAGGSHVCVLTTAGGVKCWGLNMNGALGDGKTGVYQTFASNVTGLTAGVSRLSTGAMYSCAVLSAGGMKCWGSNSEGQLGDNTTTSRATPVTVPGIDGSAIDTVSNWATTCVLLSSNQAKCWGANTYGQQGRGHADSSLTKDFVSE